MVKLASLLSQTIGALMLQMRMRAWVVFGGFTFHVCKSSLAVLEKIVFQLLPPSLEMSILTFPTTPLEVQMMVPKRLFNHVSPPLGEMTLSDGSGVGGVTPVPVTEGDALPPLEVKVTLPLNVAADEGLKRTVTLWLAPAPRLNDAAPTMVKPVADVEALPVSVPPPVFVTVKARSLLDPTV
ncbi:MAG: hypothetical protein HY574_13410, partial [candidate division NC10 bacterium]|nr:hypothetical protein [candidate division NC10 bacterium]